MERETTALIGYTGFIGQTLLRERSFGEVFNRKNIQDMKGQRFSDVICAGAPAEKWKANLSPEEDFANISGLWDVISHIGSEQFTLISTVDVFGDPSGVNETDDPNLVTSSPYGANRLWLENKVREKFENHLIVRLPGLVGAGLKKNVIFDLVHHNNLAAIDHRNVFQFYPVSKLSSDIDLARSHAIEVLHLTAQPVSVGELAKNCFGMTFENALDSAPIAYDFQTQHAGIWGESGAYQYMVVDTYDAVREYHLGVIAEKVQGL